MNKYFKAPQNQEELEKIALEIDEEIRAEEEEVGRQCYEATDWSTGNIVTIEY